MTIAKVRKDLEVAEAEAKSAADAHAREQRRLEQTNAEVAAITAQIQDADPEDDKLFAKLVAQRDTARGRGEALAIRIGKAEGALEKARERVKEASAAVLQAELDEIDTKIREKDEALMSEAVAFRKRLVERAAEIRELTAKANGMVAESTGYVPLGQHRETRWAKVHEYDAFEAASWVVGEPALKEKEIRRAFGGR